MNKLDIFAKALGVEPNVLIDAALPFTQYAQRLGVSSVELFKITVQNFDATADGRAVAWRARLRLYRDGTLDPIADTDPELPPDADGTDVIVGLNGVGHWAARIARTFHSPYDLGNIEHEFIKRIPSVRPTLSRNDGVAAWRIPYKMNGENWLARVDLKRDQNAPNDQRVIGMRELLTKLRSEGYGSN